MGKAAGADEKAAAGFVSNLARIILDGKYSIQQLFSVVKLACY